MIHENKTFTEPKLVHLDLETSSICNFNCNFCQRPKENGQMPIEDIKRIIKEFADQGGETIKLFHRGEPTADIRMPEILEYSRSLGLKNMLNTNGSFPKHDKWWLFNFFKNLDWLSFSIDKQHNNINKKTLNYIKKARLGNVKHIEVQGSDYSEYLDSFCHAFKIPYKVDKPTKRSDKDDSSEVLHGDRKYCGFLDWRLIVQWNGDVVPCCLIWDSEIVVGNVYKQSLTEIFNSDKMNKLRSELKQNIFSYDICKTCQSRKAYK